MLFVVSLSNDFKAWIKLVPPPGKIPLSTADLHEFKQSIILSLISSCSTSVNPPTPMIALLPCRLFNLLLRVSFICLFSSSLISRIKSLIPFFISSLSPPVPHNNVSNSFIIARLAEPIYKSLYNYIYRIIPLLYNYYLNLHRVGLF